MAAGVITKLWEIPDVVAMIEVQENITLAITRALQKGKLVFKLSITLNAPKFTLGDD